MKIRYENTLEDLVAFNRYHCHNSPAARRERAINLWGGIALGLAGTAVVSAVLKEPYTLLGGLCASALWLLVARYYSDWWTDRRARKQYGEGENKGVLGTHELELTPDSLIEKTQYGGTVTALEAIEKLDSSDRYTFIYVSAVSGYVIPHDAVSEGSHEAFVAELRRRLQGTRAAAEGANT
jgi:hypothetical protein